MHSLLSQLQTHLIKLPLKPEETAAISSAIDTVLADARLLETAKNVYHALFEQEKLLDREEIIQWQEPYTEEALGCHLLYTIVMFARAYELTAFKRYVYNNEALDFFAPLLRHFRGNVERYCSVGLQEVKRFWAYCYLKPISFELGRLAFEITEYPYQFHVYQDPVTGETVPVALAGLRFDEAGLPDNDGSFVTSLEQTANAVIGYTYTNDGHIDFEKKTFYNHSCVLNNTDMAIAVHMPGNEKLSAEAVTASLEGAKAFFAQYFPKLDYKAFICSSWLMSTELKAFLSEDSNIMKLQKRFRITLAFQNDFSLFDNIFCVPKCPIEELIPQNRFQREVLQMIKNGGSLYSGRGYILK